MSILLAFHLLPSVLLLCDLFLTLLVFLTLIDGAIVRGEHELSGVRVVCTPQSVLSNYSVQISITV
jgi:hypothetical protein